MAKKNILGEGFPKYVRDQVKIRQEGLGENPISNASIIKNDGKTAWIKLASSIDLNSQAQKELAVTANFDEFLNVQNNNYAARSLVLYNGTTNTFFDNQRSGIQGPYTWQGGITNTRTGITGSGTVSDEGGAYGFGGFQQGAVPMPGIRDFKVIPRNRGGIRDATINIRANNIRQFQLLESLYFRLGYHVLIEWGWNTYYDNGGNLVVVDIEESRVLDNFLRTDRSEYYHILDLISQEKEKSNGNYDALLGRVVNFNWTLLEGGKYDISIRVLSAGDIIDSLKLPNLPSSEAALLEDEISILENKKPEEKLPVNAQIYALQPEANKSSIHRWLWLLEHILTPNVDESGARIDFLTPATSIKLFRDTYLSIYNNDFGILPELRPYAGPSGIWGANGFYLTQLIPGDNGYGDVNTSYGVAEAPRIGAWYASFRNENADFSQVRDYYITFGTLLGFISKTLLYYNQNVEQPIIDIDFDLNNNLCYTYPIVPGICNTTTLSIDDNTCLVNAYAYVKDKKTNIISTKSLWPEVFPLQYQKFNEDSINSHGRIMAINLTTSFIKKCADQAYDKVEHAINLQPFLDALLEGINSCFYGTINLVTQIDPDTNILYILDLSQIPDIDSLGVDTTLTKFRVSGFNLGEASFLKDISITSEISKNIANQLAIGAQQSGNVISNIPTGLTKFNEGYTDRVFEKKLDSYQTKEQILLDKTQKTRDEALQLKKETAALDLFLKQYQLFARYINLALTNRLPSDSASVEYYKIVESIIKWELSQITSDLPNTTDPSGNIELQGQNPPGYIPISLNITMEGLAGMKLFNKFTISEEYLPFSYRNQFDFIVKGITHELKNNYWNTMIESLCVPKPKNIIGPPSEGQGINTIGTTPSPSSTSGTSGGGSVRSGQKCATDPNDNFGRLVGSEADIPSPWNKKFTVTENKNIIYLLFRIAGFTQEQAAVALANAQAESNFNNLANGDSCQSYGLFQTHTTRGVAAEALKGKYVNSLIYKVDTRYAFFNPYVNTLFILDQAFRQNLKNSTSIASATITFVDKIERPNDRAGAKKTRASYASNYQNYKISGAEADKVLTELSKEVFLIPGNKTVTGTQLLSQLINYWGTIGKRNTTPTGSDAAAVNALRNAYLKSNP